MKVHTINATVKYSRQLKDGEWKGLEIGAEATIDPGEDRREAHRALYGDLAAQLKELFTNGPDQASGKRPGKPKKSVPDNLPSKKQPEEPSDPSWCSIHKVKMKRRQKNGGVWYSHKTKDGWCRGRAQRKGPRS